ncbi:MULTISPECIES: hypothetical protein [unclassified Cupriavidus]|uniref:hypothetical protein n=1 Tax=unclassified Cupriavidus TaxID=2640874 RepID=UPI00313BF7D7
MNIAFPAVLLFLLVLPGFVFRLFAQRREVRTVDQWVRGEAPWYYLFSGLDHPDAREVDGTVVAAVVEFKAEGSYLCQGMMLDYEVNEAGDLDRLLLVQAQRRKLTSDRAYDAAMGQHEEDTNRFYPIAGDVFVLRYDEIRTLNVTYLSLGSSGV